VAVGEKTGTYEKALLRLADLEEANQELKNKVMTAAFYPIIMLVLLGGIVLFLLGVVFPQIEQLFAQVDAELPLITRAVIGLSNFITSVWMPVTMAGMAVLFLFFYRWKKTPDGQRTWERFVLKQPLFGSLGRKYLLATFARNLGVMLQNRVPLIAALQVVGDVVNHGLFGDEIRRAIERIKEGSRITESLQDSIIINQMMLGMLSAGEAADRVPEMVTRIADVMDGELDGTIQRLSSMLEPIMIVVMGGLIVVIMLAILLPMYRLTESLQM
ncbi:MAG: type II secretion system F family protein, partial [Leptospiraceae bacterium]|nr:type II secretion system F family protein [Leptospiraceae bacterium]